MQFERTDMFSTKVVVMYKGANKLYAIKALREVFGIGLKEAKESIEHPSGIEMYATDYNALIRWYHTADLGIGIETFIDGWQVHRSKPIDLVR